ncbi:MAG: HDOD domain-containing protein [Rhodocyclaceae bacterium]|nr:HDOD domain-containing protein [Rhodocyclaceae bacterium]
MGDNLQDCLGLVLRFSRELENGEVIFPTSTAVSARLLAALNDPDMHLQQAARIIQTEPLVATRIISLANSAMAAGARQVGDVPSALLRVGLNAARVLALLVVTKQLLRAPGLQKHKALAAELWQRSAYLAALCRVIALRMSRVNADEALYAGLAHNLGQFYLLSRAAEKPELLDQSKLFTKLLYGYPAIITRPLLTKLQIPSRIIEAVTTQGRAAAIPPQSLYDVVALARLLTPQAGPGSEPAANATPEFSEIDVIRDCIASAGEDLDGTLRMLHA